ncbi:hypothetical protein B0H11DRAFT_1814598 [Mycena galericulata]|nr:hypothetical protein B0H11DRAFT_1814598 [Mycena galericulata]
MSYTLLRDPDEPHRLRENCADSDSYHSAHKASVGCLPRRFLVLPAILNVILTFLLIGGNFNVNSNVNPRLPTVYSPAQTAVQYKIVKFTRGLGNDIPIYEQPPSVAVDKAWRALYAFSETQVPKSEANKTWPILGDSDHYLLALDAFHQLHCLDILRQRLHPGHNYTRTGMSMNHIRHCIGAIRQGLMCAADISTVVWQWSHEFKRAEQRDDVPHVCRDYEKIQDWAKSHHAAEPFPDLSVYVEPDLDIPLF